MNIIVLEGNTVSERNAWLKKLLTQGVYEVTFTKVNGETRTMPCTLDPQRLPAAPIKESANTKVRKEDALSVWCVDKNEWRSFKVMNILEIKES